MFHPVVLNKKQICAKSQLFNIMLFKNRDKYYNIIIYVKVSHVQIYNYFIRFGRKNRVVQTL